MHADLKIILLGDAASGKTKLMERFLLDNFNPRRLSTHAVNIFPYSVAGMCMHMIGMETLSIVDGRKWDVDFWDTAGQEQFDKLHPSYYFGADCAILAFDITRKVTYKNLERWYSELRDHCPNIPVICVANKIDIDMSLTNRQFSFPVSQDLPFYFVSASTGVNVVRIFNESIKLGIMNQLEPKDEVMNELIKLLRLDDNHKPAPL